MTITCAKTDEQERLEFELIDNYLKFLSVGKNIWTKYPFEVYRPVEDQFFKQGYNIQHLVVQCRPQIGTLAFTFTIRMEYELHKICDNKDVSLNKAFQAKRHRISLCVLDHNSETGRKGVCEIVFTSNNKTSHGYNSLKQIFQETWEKAIRCNVCERASRPEALRKLIAVLENNKNLY